jgi:acetyltransferase-like isoleucine patch superfamily enzyme
MKIFMYILNFMRNIFGLLRISAKSEIVYWDTLARNAANCNIDKQAVVLKNYTLSRVTVGKGTYIADDALITDTSIGKFCSIGPKLLCGWGIHPINGISTSPAFYSTKKQTGFTFSKTDKCEEQKHITIGNDVFIGSNVTILDGVTIGDGAVIGAGAVVSKDIPPYAVAVGCPIQIVKYRFSPEIIDALLASQWWDKEDDVLQQLEKHFYDVEAFLEIVNKK